MPIVPSKGSPHHSSAPVLGEHFTLGRPSWILCGVSSEAPFRLSKQGLSSAKTGVAARQESARTALPNAYLFMNAYSPLADRDAALSARSTSSPCSAAYFHPCVRITRRRPRLHPCRFEAGSERRDNTGPHSQWFACVLHFPEQNADGTLRQNGEDEEADGPVPQSDEHFERRGQVVRELADGRRNVSRHQQSGPLLHPDPGENKDADHGKEAVILANAGNQEHHESDDVRGQRGPKPGDERTQAMHAEHQVLEAQAMLRRVIKLGHH